MLDIHQIMEYLPHRYPFLLVDRVLSYEPNESLVAIKNVTFNEPFFPGHFPHRPVMPGVLMLESMVQASAILAALSLGTRASEKRIYYFVGVDKARFKRPVEPGDQMRITVSMGRRIKNMFRCSATAHVGDELACKGEFVFTFKDME